MPVMRLLLFLPLAFVVILSHVGPASASPAEAREVARINNCAPKKIEVYLQKIGGGSQTIYRVDCIPPKMVGENLPKLASTMLVQCNGSLCEMLRPMEGEVK